MSRYRFLHYRTALVRDVANKYCKLQQAHVVTRFIMLSTIAMYVKGHLLYTFIWISRHLSWIHKQYAYANLHETITIRQCFCAQYRILSNKKLNLKRSRGQEISTIFKWLGMKAGSCTVCVHSFFMFLHKFDWSTISSGWFEICSL